MVPKAPPLVPWAESDAEIVDSRSFVFVSPDDYNQMNLSRQFAGGKKWRFKFSDGSVAKSVNGRPMCSTDEGWVPVRTW